MKDEKELEVEIKKILDKDKQSHSLDEIQKKLNILGEIKKMALEDALNDLNESGYLLKDEKHGCYKRLTNDQGLAFGTIDINRNGNGHVHTNDGYTIFIPSLKLNGALDGDSVIVANIIPGRKDTYEGEIQKIVKRKNGKALFQIVKTGDAVSFIPYNNNYNVNIELNKNDLKKLVDGDIIEVLVPEEQNDGIYFACLNKVVGNIADADVDLKALAAEFQIDATFTEEELDQANSLPTSVLEEDKVGRRDLTNLPFVTIDCDNTKDRDDSVYVEKLDSGNYKLYVSIASVNHYIKRDTPLFEGIKRRCTSHYPNNMVIPMLPHVISNGICSLNEGVDRLTKTCEMEIDETGQVVDYDIYNSVIKSRKAMRYSDVNKIFAGEKVSGYEEFEDNLSIMKELSSILTDAGKKREYLEFVVPEIQVSKGKDENEFYLNEQKEAEKLIENFMVITNSTVAGHYSWIPFIYRVHEAPDEDVVKSVIKKMNLCGYKVVMDGRITRGSLNALLKKFKTKEECQIFHQMLLKAMAKAKYSIHNGGHYALRIEDYCHFTSPIRRSADFMIHTAIDDLEENNYDMKYVDLLEKELQEVSENATKEEINDFKFEDEARKMAMAENMEHHIGEEYEGVITEIYPHGAFIRTSNLIEGKVSLNDIGGENDKYRYDQERYAIISKKAHQSYHVGDKVLVEAISASKHNRTVNFRLERKKA